METIELQCGSCNQVMGVGVDSLGGQVQCPHCSAVVQVPDAAAFGLEAPAPPPMETTLPPLQSAPDPASIFAPPSAGSDNIFGEPAAVEPRFQAAPPPRSESPPDEDHLPPAFISHRPPAKSNASAVLFAILIPYALLTTGLIAWLLWSQNRQRFEPLERLPDPKPLEGPRQVSMSSRDAERQG